MGKTTIEWTDLSLNPIRARRIDNGQRVPGHFCQKISPGCAHCYASNFQPRFHMPTFNGVNKSPAEQGVEVYLDEKVLLSLLKHKKPAKVFWCDMSDLFGDWVPFEWIDKCFAVMALTPHLTHQILTKRPERMAEYLNDYRSPLGFKTDENVWKLAACMDGANFTAAYKSRLSRIGAWPQPNVWLGTSCENQKTADDRIPHLLKCPAAVLFISGEPLLQDINLRRIKCIGAGFVDALDGRADDGSQSGGEFHKDNSSTGSIGWVIVGGESGHGARPMHPDWARSIRDQCSAAGVPFHFKQWGSFSYTGVIRIDEDRPHVNCFDGEGKEWALSIRNGRVAWLGPRDNLWSLNHDHLPRTDLVERVRVGKKSAGRLLDGRTWDEFPKAAGVQS